MRKIYFIGGTVVLAALLRAVLGAAPVRTQAPPNAAVLWTTFTGNPNEAAFKATAARAAADARKGRFAMEKGRFADAEHLFRRSTSEARFDLISWQDLAHVLDREGKSSQAMEVYRLLVYGDDRSELLRATRAGRGPSPYNTLLHGPVIPRSVDPGIQMRYVLGLLSLGRSQEAIAVYNGALHANARRKEGTAELLRRNEALASATNDPARLASARAQTAYGPDPSPLDALVEVDPTEPNLTTVEAGARLVVGISKTGLMTWEHDQAEFGEGLQDLVRAKALMPRSAVAQQAYGEALRHAHRFEEARQAYGRAKDLAGSNSDLRSHLQLDLNDVNRRIPHRTVVISGPTP